MTGQSRMDRATLLIARMESGEVDEKSSFSEEILCFIVNIHIRSAARDLVAMSSRSFSRASALRKLLEADEALMRAGAIEIATQEALLRRECGIVLEKNEGDL